MKCRTGPQHPSSDLLVLYTTLWTLALQKLDIRSISLCAHVTNDPQHCCTAFIRPLVQNEGQRVFFDDVPECVK